jgi:hypothetical protein
MVDFESEVECYLKTERLVEVLKNCQVDSLSEIYEVLTAHGICDSREIEASRIFDEHVRGFLRE